MSFQDCGGGSSSSVPSWAQRANEPLVASLDLAAVKRDVQRDLKEIKKASDEISRLAKKRGSRDAGPQLLSISERTRELARGTSRRLRDALSLAPEGSSDHRALSKLSDDFRTELKRFQHEAENAAPGTAGGAPRQAAPPGPTGGSLDIEAGGGAPQERTPSMGASQEQIQAQAQLQAVALNDSIIQEREEDIANIHRTVGSHLPPPPTPLPSPPLPLPDAPSPIAPPHPSAPLPPNLPDAIPCMLFFAAGPRGARDLSGPCAARRRAGHSH